MVKFYTKDSTEKISDNFSSKEFDCPCTQCSLTCIDTELVTLLEGTRALAKVPVHISKGGGFRCDFYQKDLAERGYETAKGVSQHTLGMAVDISTKNHSGLELEALARQAGFKAVGVGGLWIHVDLRGPQIRRWEYKR